MKRLLLLALLACRSKAPPPPVEIVVSTPSASTTPIASVAPSTSSSSQIAEMDGLVPATGSIVLPGVACKVDGQMGPHDGVVPAKHEAPLTKALAKLKKPETKLALYYGDGGVVMAPIGWRCLSFAGSGGGSTFAVPPNVDTKKPITSPIVSTHQSVGGTSGRFTVVAVGAPIFPMLGPMARDVKKGWPDTAIRPPYSAPAGESLIVAKTLARYVDDPGITGLAKIADDLVPSPTGGVTGSIRVVSQDYGFDLDSIAIRLEGLHVELIAPIQADFEDRTLR